MKNEQPKRYRLKEKYNHFYTSYSAGMTYDGDYKALTFGNTVEEIAKKNPDHWELVTDEPEPFKPTHVIISKGNYYNAKVVLVHQNETGCKIKTENNEIRFCHLSDIKPLQDERTTLTEQQYTSLVKAIYNVIMNSNDELGMADMGECELLAENTVKTWMEQNQIKLP